MWKQITAYVQAYPSVVVTGMDAKGYPYSVRCHVQPDMTAEVVQVDLPSSAEIQPGPASLMGHYYDEQLWQQTSFVLNGRLEQRENGWHFHPEKVVGEISQNPLAVLRSLFKLRRTAHNYLKKRNLPKPKVAYEEIHALWEEIERDKK